jgi:hypothetical protein
LAVSIKDFSSDLPDQNDSTAILSSRRGPMRGVPRVATAREDVDLEDVDSEDVDLEEKFDMA